MKTAHPFHHWVRLEQPRFGTRVNYATDEFFAAKERLIDPAAAVFIDGKYDDHGKWMDGWESRRKRVPGHDFCVIRLGVPGVIRGFDIDTSHFTGNYPPAASIEACVSNAETPEEGWVEILGRTDLSGDAHHFHEIDDERVWTHLRLHIYPDGGIARLRVFGEVKANFEGVEGFVDFAAVENGGRAIACSDEHYGSMHNLNVPGRGINMGDGWETARRRGPGNDWVILSLAQPGVIERAEVDTAHFKGNYPDRVSLEAGLFGSDAEADPDSNKWQTLLPRTKLKMDQQHYFEPLEAIGAVSHVRMSIYPDGGVSRLRLFGRVGGMNNDDYANAQVLTRERFAPYGDVIETSREHADAMNEARFERFDDLCRIDPGENGRIAISIARCRTPSELPLRLDMVERHPLGSQAFVPLTRCKMVVVVAPPGESVDAGALRAFVSNGRQGINYLRGTWHMPLIAFEEGQEYLIIDRGGNEPNCDIHTLDEAVLLEAD